MAEQGRVQLLDPETLEILDFATAPQNVKTSAGTAQASIDLDEFGALSRPRGRPPTTYSWSGTFYGGSRLADPWVDLALWRPPAEMRATLERWHDGQPRRRMPLELTVLHPGYPTILKPVYITSLDFTWSGGFGDVPYQIELTEWRMAAVGVDDQGAQTSEEVTSTEAGAEGAEEPPVPATVNVQPGDTLWGLAQLHLGDGARWQELYDLNAEAIGPDPNTLEVGTQLVIPGGTVTGEDRPPDSFSGFSGETDSPQAWSPPLPV